MTISSDRIIEDSDHFAGVRKMVTRETDHIADTGKMIRSDHVVDVNNMIRHSQKQYFHDFTAISGTY